MILAKSLEERLAIARHAREESMVRGQRISMEIIDVNDAAVKKAIAESGVDVLLHGHTHRPDVHEVDLGERVAKRIVLGDWYEQGSIVRWDDEGPELVSLPR